MKGWKKRLRESFFRSGGDRRKVRRLGREVQAERKRILKAFRDMGLVVSEMGRKAAQRLDKIIFNAIIGRKNNENDVL